MKRIYFVSLIVLTLWVMLLVGKLVVPQINSTKQTAISSFDECAAAGYDIMDSDPQQCRTPDGRTFVASKPPVRATPQTEPTNKQADTSATAAQAARADLAKKLVVAENAITIVSSQESLWPDGCLGIYKPDVMCTQAFVPGYEVTLSFANEQYIYRTNKDGSIIAQAQ